MNWFQSVEAGAVAPHDVVAHVVTQVRGVVGEDLLVAKADPHRAPEMGTEVGLLVEVDALHLFDAGTEQRLGPA